MARKALPLIVIASHRSSRREEALDDSNLEDRDTGLAGLVWDPDVGVEGRPQSDPPVVVGTVAVVVARSSSWPLDCMLDNLRWADRQRTRL